MAWTSPPTFTDGSVLTGAQLNLLRDDLNETAPAKATTAGRLIMTSGANAIVERAAGSATVNTQETTTSTTFTDLATSGPTVSSLSTGTAVTVMLSACLFNSTAGSTAQMSVQVSGASTSAASTNTSLIYESSASADISQMSFVFPISGLTAGSNTFTTKYRADPSGTATFLRRNLIVLPFA